MDSGTGGSLDPANLLNALSRGGRALAAAANFSEGVQHLLAHIGEASGGSRVWIFQTIELNRDSIVQDYVFEWAAADRYRQLSLRRFRFFSMNFDDKRFARVIAERSSGVGQVIIPAELQPGSYYDYLATQDIRSTVAVPIMVGGRWWGTLGIDDCERTLAWGGAGIDTLTVAAELIAAAIERQQVTGRSVQVEIFQKVTDCGVWEVDLQSGTLWCSQGLRRTLGYPGTYPKVPLRRGLARILPKDRTELFRNMKEAIEIGATYLRHDARVRVASGEYRWSEIVADISYGDDRRPNSIAGLLIDISHRKRQEEQALTASHQDALTELLNRRGFEQRFLELAPPPADQDEADPRGPHLLLLDIDHFKLVNDRHGHLAGDVLLRLLSQRIQRSLKPDDAFARLGGEEFAILLEAVTTKQALATAERIRRSIAGEGFVLELPDTEAAIHLTITASIGFAPIPDADDPLARQSIAIARADQALYAAKRRGRNRVVVYEEETPATDGAVFDERRTTRR